MYSMYASGYTVNVYTDCMHWRYMLTYMYNKYISNTLNAYIGKEISMHTGFALITQLTNMVGSESVTDLITKFKL